MAQLDVEKKKNNDWWKWVVGILALAIIIWIIVEAVDDDDMDDMDDMEQPMNMDDTSSLPEKEADYSIIQVNRL